ncbi:carbohydrate-binding module family 13 protein [Lactarius pseudohatsudake]|nr:carbohydrate-binding module family 13 protein [Lactarius pseudohatsudake]KAH9032979.1 carbohydrate-binding module family 13 protein [Lactarius pseudohatsudake]
MSIQSGRRYKIINKASRLVVDLSGADNRSILGYDYHGGGNQQWIIDRQDNDQWTIRSAEHHKYLGVVSTPRDGIQLVGVDEPQSWNIEILGEAGPVVKLGQWNNDTFFVADFPLERQGNSGAIQLWTAWGGENQSWILEELN